MYTNMLPIPGNFSDFSSNADSTETAELKKHKLGFLEPSNVIEENIVVTSVKNNHSLQCLTLLHKFQHMLPGSINPAAKHKQLIDENLKEDGNCN